MVDARVLMPALIVIVPLNVRTVSQEFVISAMMAMSSMMVIV